MKKSEAARIVAMLQGAWGQRNVSESMSEVYEMALADLDYELAKAAVMRLVQISRFLPTVAEIREAAVRDRVSLPTAEEAWGIVRRAIGKHGSYVVPVFDCDEIQRAVDAISWKEICLGDNPVSNRARWIDAFKAFVARRMESEAMGRYVPSSRTLPAAGYGDGFVEDGRRVLVETGYPTPREELPALGDGDDRVLDTSEFRDALVGGLVHGWTRTDEP